MALFGPILREVSFLQRFVHRGRMQKFNFVKIGSWEDARYVISTYPIISPDTILDNMEIYPSVTSLVVERSRNLNYLCPFLLTETFIDNRWARAVSFAKQPEAFAQ